jgi:hypothetical protein
MAVVDKVVEVEASGRKKGRVVKESFDLWLSFEILTSTITITTEHQQPTNHQPILRIASNHT